MNVLRPFSGRLGALVLLLSVVVSGCDVMPGSDGVDPTMPVSTLPSTSDAVEAPSSDADALTSIESIPTPSTRATRAASPAPSPETMPSATATATSPATEQPTIVPTPTQVPLPPLPISAHLDPMTHAYQTWNNCSAVSASMVLSYFGVTRTQEQLATVFRPNLNDKHVEPKQLVRFFPDYGLRADLYEGGSIEVVKRLVAAGFPVMTPQWLDFKPDAIGHYRVVRGYDDARGGFLVNDSMTGADVLISYDNFEQLWRAFNNRYLPVYRPEDRPRIEQIVGSDIDRQTNLERALALFTDLAAKHPDDAYYRFAIGSSFFELGNYAEAVAAYERAAAIGLPSKMLWYQFWPVAAYNEIGNQQRALELATAQIASAGTFAEMRFERGRAFEALGRRTEALAEYRQAINDDANLQAAQDAVARLGG
ncbi:MAG TPA: C39 family peptidase [Nitrolancea sp.]|nr:C39 family peptidase [Nitrolancea sp.]